MDNSLKERARPPLMNMGSNTHAETVKDTYMNRYSRSLGLRGLLSGLLLLAMGSMCSVEARYTPGSARDRGGNPTDLLEDATPLMREGAWRPSLPKMPSLNLHLLGFGKKDEPKPVDGETAVYALGDQGVDPTQDEIIENAEADREILLETKATAAPDANKAGLVKKAGTVFEKNVVGVFRKKAKPAFGYLISSGPAPIRFSDEKKLTNRTPSPALPEFSLMSIDYDPYLIESPLPEDEKNGNSVYADVVIEMEPVKIVSGDIDYDKGERVEDIADVAIEEERASVVRAEDVLIFFESKSSSGRTGALIPFSPAPPASSPPAKSKATYQLQK